MSPTYVDITSHLFCIFSLFLTVFFDDLSCGNYITFHLFLLLVPNRYFLLLPMYMCSIDIFNNRGLQKLLFRKYNIYYWHCPVRVSSSPKWFRLSLSMIILPPLTTLCDWMTTLSHHQLPHCILFFTLFISTVFRATLWYDNAPILGLNIKQCFTCLVSSFVISLANTHPLYLDSYCLAHYGFTFCGFVHLVKC